MIANEVDVAEYERLVLVTEHDHQVRLFQWALENTTILRPELALLHHIPNGGKRQKTVALQLQRAGVKPGVPDLCLPVARHGFNGLYIELKRPKGNGTSPAQEQWIADLTAQGYKAVVCYGWEAAAGVLSEYLGHSNERDANAK